MTRRARKDMTARRPLAALALAGLAGCAVGPDYQRPDLPAGAGYTPETLVASTAGGAPVQRFESGTDVEGEWWALYRSPELDALIRQALAANPDLQAAQAALRQAHENVAVAEGDFLPQMEGTLGATRERVGGSSFGVPNAPATLFSVYNASVNVSYVPDIFGGTRRAVEASAADEEYSRFELEAAVLSLTGNVVTTAVQEASLRAQLAATDEIAAAERQQLDVVRRRFDLGGASQAEVLSQEATLAATEANLPPLKKQLAAMRAQLAVYAGRPPSDDGAGQFTLDALALPQTLPVELPSKLVEQRPDIRAAEAQLHAASAQVGVAVANMLPQIKLTGSYGDMAVKLGSLFDPGNAVWNIGASLTQPLLDENTLLHKKRGAEAAFDQAAAQYRSTVLKSFQDVANALHAVAFDAETHAAEITAERAAADSLKLSREQYALGAVAFPTLLDAEKSWQQARLALVQAEAARYADAAALFAALGGGWWNRQAPPEAADQPYEEKAG